MKSSDHLSYPHACRRGSGAMRLLAGILPSLLAGSMLFAAGPAEAQTAFKVPSCAKPAPETQLTLAAAIRQAFCRNPQTRQWWATVGSREARLHEADAAYWPQLNAQYQADRSRRGGITADTSPQSAALSASYLLYDFGGRSAAAEQAKAQLQAAIATRDSQLNQLAYSVAQAYLDVLLAQASLDAAKVSEASSLETLKAAEVKLSVGRAIPADKLQAQTAYSQAQLARIKAEGALRTRRATLAYVMGLPPQARFELVPWQVKGLNKQTRAVGQLTEQALASRQDLRAAQEQVKAAKATVESARAQGKPTITLGASAGRQVGGGYPPANSKSIGVTISAPIFTGYRDTYRTRAAEADLENARAQETQLADQVRLDVWNAYQNFRTDSDALKSAHDAVTSGEANEKVMLGRFKAGVGTMLDVLSAQASAATARQQQASAEHDYLLSKFALAQALGRLAYGRLPSIGE